MVLREPFLIVSSPERGPRRPWRAFAMALPLLAALVAGAAVAGEPIIRQVLDIEGRYGNDPNQVIEHLRTLEAPARASGGDDLRAFLAAWGFAHGATDKPAVADAAIDELTDIGERSHDAASLASAYALKASMLSFAGQERAAYGWIEEALPYARRTASPDLRYWVEMTAADLAMSNGRLDEGIQLFEAAAKSAREVANPRREAQAWQSLVPMRIVTGDLAGALRDAVKVRELGGRSTDPGLVVAGWVLESLAAFADGQGARGVTARLEAARAQRRIGQALAASAPDGKPPVDSMNSQAGQLAWLSSEQDALMTLADQYLALRNWPKAAEAAMRARRESASQHDGDTAAHALIDLGMAHIGLGQVPLGQQEADQGLRALERVRRGPELLIQLNRYVLLLERSGDQREALARLRQALLLESELTRKDRDKTVVTLQRESSFAQHQRQVERLEHENILQAVELSRRSNERLLMLALAAVLGVGVVAAWRLYRRARRSNRELAVINEKLAHASLHDKVTGLFNRSAMEADTRAIELAGDATYCNVSISVKQFGLIVGSVGHQLGDQLLCQIAARLAQAVFGLDGTLYRIDGVTFAALFRFGRDPRRLRGVLEALTAAMEVPFEIGNQDLIVSIGVGASEYPKDAGSAEEVARLAELAKLQAHADPGNSVLVYDTRLGESQRDKLHMESRMLKALEHGDFELFYQGQRDLADGRIFGFEALLRWRDGERMIPPADFIPLAEESGLIVRIGAWVLEQACRQAKAWSDAGFGRPLVAVNISPRQFNHPDFLATVRDTLARTGVDPRRIELEITEGSVMNDAEASIAQLRALRAMGLHLAIDDFGTGYASLSYLRRFPLDRLKIDRSFIRELNASEQDDTIVRTVIELAHTLGLSVTAEGVETMEQESVLRGWGCDVIQGFLHFKPAPAAMATMQLDNDRQDALELA